MCQSICLPLSLAAVALSLCLDPYAVPSPSPQPNPIHSIISFARPLFSLFFFRYANDNSIDFVAFAWHNPLHTLNQGKRLGYAWSGLVCSGLALARHSPMFSMKCNYLLYFFVRSDIDANYRHI